MISDSITDDPMRRSGEHRVSGRLTSGASMKTLDKNVNYGQARGYEQYYIEKYGTRTGTIGEDISSINRGNKYNSFDHNRTDTRADAFREAYDSKTRSSGKVGGKC